MGALRWVHGLHSGKTDMQQATQQCGAWRGHRGLLTGLSSLERGYSTWIISLREAIKCNEHSN